MATEAECIKTIQEQLSMLKDIQVKKMFGEYAIYYHDCIVAIVCDNQLLIKPTSKGKVLLQEVKEVPPYKGAKPCYLIENIEDRAFIAKLIEQTYLELSKVVKVKKKK